MSERTELFMAAMLGVLLFCLGTWLGHSDGYGDGQRDAINGKWFYVQTHGEIVRLSKPATQPFEGGGR